MIVVIRDGLRFEAEFGSVLISDDIDALTQMACTMVASPVWPSSSCGRTWPARMPGRQLASAGMKKTATKAVFM